MTPKDVADDLAKMIYDVDLITSCIQISLASIPKGDPRIEEWGDTPGIMLAVLDTLIQGWEMITSEEWPVIE